MSVVVSNNRHKNNHNSPIKFILPEKLDTSEMIEVDWLNHVQNTVIQVLTSAHELLSLCKTGQLAPSETWRLEFIIGSKQIAGIGFGLE